MSKTGVPETAQAPVTGLTGYIGAGKTTLLNGVISEYRDRSYAVVVSKLSQLGVDDDLVIDADEEVFEKNSRCIFCTVRVWLQVADLHPPFCRSQRRTFPCMIGYLQPTVRCGWLQVVSDPLGPDAFAPEATIGALASRYAVHANHRNATWRPNGRQVTSVLRRPAGLACRFCGGGLYLVIYPIGCKS